MPPIHRAATTQGHSQNTPGGQPSRLADDGLFRSVFDNTLEAIVVWDSRGRVLEANAEACYLFDRSLEQMRASIASA